MSINELKELHELKQQGVITEKEFEIQKEQILGSRLKAQPKAQPTSPTYSHRSLIDIFADMQLGNILPIVLLNLAFLVFSGLFLILENSYTYRDNFFCQFSLLVSIAAFIALAFLQSIVHFRAWKSLPQEYQIIAPDKAVVFLLIPLFSLYWAFPSFYSLAKQANRVRLERGLALKRVNEEVFLLFAILIVMCCIVLITLDLRFMGLSLRVFAYNYETLYYFLIFWSITGLYVTHQETALIATTQGQEGMPMPVESSRDIKVAGTVSGQTSKEPVQSDIKDDLSQLLTGKNVRLLIGLAIVILVLGLFWFFPTNNPVHSITRILFFIYGALLIALPQWAPLTLLLPAIIGIATTFYYLIGRSFTYFDAGSYRPVDILILPAAQIIWLVFFHKSDISLDGAIGTKEKLKSIIARTNWKRFALQGTIILITVVGIYSLITFVNWRSNYLRINAYALIKSSDGMSFRLGPSIKDKSIQVISHGQYVYVTGENPDEAAFFGTKSKWYMVEFKGKRGWMWGGQSESMGEVDSSRITDPVTISKLIKLEPKDITASGWLEAPSEKYHPRLVNDGKKDSVWADAKYNAPGIGEYISFAFEKPVSISTIGIVNGLHRESGVGQNDSYLMNASPKKIQVELSNGYSQTIVLDRTREMQYFSIPTQVNVNSTKVTILSEYPGLAYQDTCISQLVFY